MMTHSTRHPNNYLNNKFGRHQALGFTLVELVVVVLVLGILALLAIFGYGSVQQSTRVSAVKTVAHALDHDAVAMAATSSPPLPAAGCTTVAAANTPGSSTPCPAGKTYIEKALSEVNSTGYAVAFTSRSTPTVDATGNSVIPATYTVTNTGWGVSVCVTSNGKVGSYGVITTGVCPGGVGATGGIAAPTGLTATPGNSQIVVSWDAYSGAAGYQVTAPGSAGCATATTTCTLTGLTNGQSYTISLVAIVGSLASPAATTTATPIGVPDAPTGLSGTPATSQVTVGWTASVAHGSPVTGYTVTSSPGSFTCTTASTSCIVTGLTNNTSYVFSVVANSAAGPSPAATVSATPSRSDAGVFTLAAATACPTASPCVDAFGSSTNTSVAAALSAAGFASPSAVAVAPDGTIYVGEDQNNSYTGRYKIFKISPAGVVSVLVGDGTAGWSTSGGAYNPNTVLALSSARVGRVNGLAYANGNLYVAEGESYSGGNANGICNNKPGVSPYSVGFACGIRVINLAAQTITGLVGNGSIAAAAYCTNAVTQTGCNTTGSTWPGHSINAEHGQAIATWLSSATPKTIDIGQVYGVAVAPNGDVYFTESNTGCLFHLNVLANTVVNDYCAPFPTSGQVIANGVAIDGSGNVYFATYEGIYRLDGSARTVSLFSSTPANKSCQAITQVPLCNASSVALNSTGTILYVANSNSMNILQININSSSFGTSTYTNLAGVVGTSGYADNTTPTSATFSSLIGGLAFNPTTNNLYAADENNNAVREVNLP